MESGLRRQLPDTVPQPGSRGLAHSKPGLLAQSHDTIEDSTPAGSRAERAQPPCWSCKLSSDYVTGLSQKLGPLQLGEQSSGCTIVAFASARKFCLASQLGQRLVKPRILPQSCSKSPHPNWEALIGRSAGAESCAMRLSQQPGLQGRISVTGSLRLGPCSERENEAHPAGWWFPLIASLCLPCFLLRKYERKSGRRGKGLGSRLSGHGNWLSMAGQNKAAS